MTDELKVQEQILWVKRMNNTRARAEEIVGNEIIFNLKCIRKEL